MWRFLTLLLAITLAFLGGCGTLERQHTLARGMVGITGDTPLVGRVYPATQWDIAMFLQAPPLTAFGLDFPISLITDTVLLPWDLTNPNVSWAERERALHKK